MWWSTIKVGGGRQGKPDASGSPADPHYGRAAGRRDAIDVVAVRICQLRSITRPLGDHTPSVDACQKLWISSTDR